MSDSNCLCLSVALSSRRLLEIEGGQICVWDMLCCDGEGVLRGKIGGGGEIIL